MTSSKKKKNQIKLIGLVRGFHMTSSMHYDVMNIQKIFLKKIVDGFDQTHALDDRILKHIRFWYSDLCDVIYELIKFSTLFLFD